MLTALQALCWELQGNWLWAPLHNRLTTHARGALANRQKSLIKSFIYIQKIQSRVILITAPCYFGFFMFAIVFILNYIWDKVPRSFQCLKCLNC